MAYITFQPSDYFNTVQWTGNGSTNAITGVGFRPDWVWGKSHTDGYSHQLYDVVRGATEVIRTNGTNSETLSTGLTSFDSDGFTLGSNTNINASGHTVTAWNWRAGNSSGSSNSDGSITSTVSANTTAGFSIAKWTGTGSDGTVGHGLGAVPEMAIIKSLGNTTYWMIYHKSLGNAAEIYLNATNAANTGASTWNTTTPTSTTISLDGGSGNGVNHSGDYIGYFFTSKKGFSKFGSYTGNGNADGPFVYTGFKPAWVLFKRSSATENWSLYDNKRLGYNPQSYGLRPNLSNGQSQYATTASVDFVSNGFKIREAGTNINDGTYIYMAFAEEPLVSSNNIPATAR
jgi:hypothetical protein